MFNLKVYQEKLELLKKNREQVPEELLKTKYKAAYERLQEEVRMLTDKYIYYRLYSGKIILPEDTSMYIDKVHEELKNNKIIKEIESLALTSTFEAVQDKTFELETLVEREVYVPYFRSYIIQLGDGKFYNSLIEANWNKELGLWEGTDNGVPWFGIYYEPEDTQN